MHLRPELHDCQPGCRSRVSPTARDRMSVLEQVHQSVGPVRLARGGRGRILVPGPRPGMNVALRAVHDALRTTGHPDRRWHALVEALRECAGVTGVVGPQQLAGALRVAGIRGGSSAEWISNLRLLGVIGPADHVDAGRADTVESALGMVADSFDPVQTAESWRPVATLPPQLHAMLHPPPMRQTA